MKEENKIQTIYVENTRNEDDEINLREVVDKYIYHWKWFLLSLLVALLLAYLYLHNTQSQYNVKSTIFIDDQEIGGITSEMSVFDDLGSLNSTKKSVVNEMGVIKSHTLMENVIKKLGVNITYFEKRGLTPYELYKDNVPLSLNFQISDTLLYKLDTSFAITPVSKTHFILFDGDNEEVGEMEFGRAIKTVFGDLIIVPKKANDFKINQKITVRINPLNGVIDQYREKIKIEPEDKKSSLLVISLTDKIKQKAQDIVDNLVLEYNKDAIEYKNLITANTDQFIDDRINDISKELTSVDVGVEEFKTKNKLSDMNFESELTLTSNSELEKRIVDLNSQIRLVDYVRDHMATNRNDLIPANLGLNDAATNQNTNMYNQLLLERNRIIKSSSKLNPAVVNLDSQINTLRQSVEQSLTNLRSSLIFSLNEAQNQGYRLNTKKENAPKQEREFQDIKRKQQIVESLYLYLLEKREENAIAFGMPIPNAKIVDKAKGSDIPVSPKPLLVYLFSGILGLLIPVLILAGKSLMDNKVHTREDIEKVVKAPFLGDIPHSRIRNQVVVNDTSNHNVAEAFRLLRTNIGFMLPGDPSVTKTIFVTSTVGSEGKTFVSINLAASLALLNKKVLLIGADIRKPKLNEYLKTNSKFGLTHYLTNSSLSPEDLIIKNRDYRFDIMDSGAVPPNPSELLLNGRFESLLTYGKAQYDYIIVDTSPVIMVTDTLLLGHHADLFIYLVRANYLDKRMLKTLRTICDNKRLPNMAILLNDLNIEKESYGYGYGYGYVDRKVKNSWWKNIMKI